MADSANRGLSYAKAQAVRGFPNYLSKRNPPVRVETPFSSGVTKCCVKCCDSGIGAQPRPPGCGVILMRSWASRSAFLIIVSCLGASASPGTGLIRGQVMDEHGRPLAGATVTCAPADTSSQLKGSVKTDPSGHFTIGDLPWGRYAVSAQKPEAGYPDSRLAFYGNRKNPTSVLITSSRRSAILNFTLTARAVWLIGVVTDSVSNDPIDATFLLRRANHPENLLSADLPASYRLLVPLDVDVKLEVAAPGYKTWYYPGTDDWDDSSPLHIKRTGPMELNIQLEPERKGS